MGYLFPLYIYFNSKLFIMYELKRFHIQLTKDSPWIVELGYSLAHVMSYITSFDDEPYCYFVTKYKGE